MAHAQDEVASGIRRSSGARSWDSVRKLHPRTMAKNPVMFVVEVGSVLTTVRLVRDAVAGRPGLGFELQITFWLWLTVLFANFAEAMAEGRGKAQADTLRKARTETVGQPDRRRRPDGDACRRRSLRKGDVVHGQGRRVHPGRRRDHRRRRVGRRVGDHRRVGAGHSRVGRRPVGGHRRHARAVGLDQGAGHVRSRPHVPRSDDRARRRRRAAEDAERDRAQHPAGRPDDHLPARGRHAAAVRDLLGRAAVGLRAGLAAGLSDSDDDRRAAVGDRHRRHGPAGAAQRAGDVGPRGRSRRRRAHAAARQDRHDHARQPPGDRVRAAAGRHRRRSWPTRRSSRRWPTRRRKAGRSSCWRRRSTASAGASWRDKDAVFVPFTAQTRMSGVDLDGRADPQGRGRLRSRSTSPATAARVVAGAAADRRPDRAVRRHAARRRRTRRGRSASSTSRTSSRAASASASPICARWASRR